jgi:hypothetical protein
MAYTSVWQSLHYHDYIVAAIPKRTPFPLLLIKHVKTTVGLCHIFQEVSMLVSRVIICILVVFVFLSVMNILTMVVWQATNT